MWENISIGGGIIVIMGAIFGFLNRKLDKFQSAALTLDKHTDLCRIASLEMKRHISDELETWSKKIISVVEQNGKEGDTK